MRKRVMAMPTIDWVEPPVTKEEALNPEVAGTWQKDGFEGGHESADDFNIDRVVYPHTEGPNEKASRERQAKREEQADKIRMDALNQSRSFRIKAGNPTGQDPGPPSLYDDD